MRVIYDVLTKCVIITFRGEIDLLGAFTDQKAAVDAAAPRLARQGPYSKVALSFSRLRPYPQPMYLTTL